jgi:hypothetical protein
MGVESVGVSVLNWLNLFYAKRGRSMPVGASLMCTGCQSLIDGQENRASKIATGAPAEVWALSGEIHPTSTSSPDSGRDDLYSSGASPADDESCPVTRFNELVFAMILAGVFCSYTCRFGTFCAKSAEKIIAATKKDRLQL